MSRRLPLPAALLSPALLIPALLLAGCTTAPGAADDGAAQPSASTAADGGDARPATVDGPHLVVAGLVFDPITDDVDPDGVCDGMAGRETLEVFDRAPWPELDVPAGGATMTCGNASGAGWRHIADGHTGDFGELADLVGAEWEDVAWFAIDRALEEPTRVEAYRDDIVNYDVLVELVDDEQVERSWMVTVGFGLGSEQIITSFPDEQH
ncbi:hypothetical protein [Agrococcus sp. ProA11]|uniref:hypothetical protein n=1 Tax=Agrococcus chionoecetis TaxID=3153752 RepID=UPI003260649E